MNLKSLKTFIENIYITSPIIYIYILNHEIFMFRRIFFVQYRGTVLYLEENTEQ